MAVRTFAVASWTTSAVADTTNIVDNNFQVLQGGSATQRTKIKEVQAGGQEDSTTSPQILLLARDTTVVVTPTALSTGESDEPDDAATAALAAPVVACTASSTQPQRGKRYLANLSFNALGGLVRIRFPFGEEPTIIGATQPLGEVSLSGFTGTIPAAIGSHIKYETL
jgi:hypothetical protein